MTKKLIYKYKSEGTYLPKYTYCKVYNDGTLEAGEGWIGDNKDEHHATKKLSSVAIRDIQRVIDQNYKIFEIDSLESPGVQVLDGSSQTLYFSDERQNCTFKIENLWLQIGEYKEENRGKVETPNMDLVVKVYEEIRNILIKNGLSSEMF